MDDPAAAPGRKVGQYCSVTEISRTEDGAFFANFQQLLPKQRSKNQAPELLPRPDLYGAGYIRPAAIKFYIVTTFDAVKLPAFT
jgi:hypothetical protein